MRYTIIHFCKVLKLLIGASELWHIFDKFKVAMFNELEIYFTQLQAVNLASEFNVQDVT